MTKEQQQEFLKIQTAALRVMHETARMFDAASEQAMERGPTLPTTEEQRAALVAFYNLMAMGVLMHRLDPYPESAMKTLRDAAFELAAEVEEEVDRFVVANWPGAS